MKRTIKYFGFTLFIIFSVFLLTGCNSSKINSKVIGTWKYSDTEVSLETIFVFNEDGTGNEEITITNDGETNTSNQKYTYKTTSDKILITFEGDTDVFEWKYKFKGNDLILIDSIDTEMTFKKQ